MTPQAFEAKDLGTVGFLVLLEALLSADNALIMALMVRHLPPDQQKRALQYGMWGAFALRLLAILGASLLIKFWWIQTVGAIYLIWLPVKHFLHKPSEGDQPLSKSCFWKTVVMVDLMDLVFAVDSVLVAVAIVRHQDKLWVIMAGAILGILLLRFVAAQCIRLLEKYPRLDDMAFVLIGWSGMKLFFESHHAAARAGIAWPFPLPEMTDTVYWLVTIAIAVCGTVLALKTGDQPPPDGKM